MTDLLTAVRDHARKRYDTESAWSMVIECYTADELLAVIDDAQTEREAIRRVGVEIAVNEPTFGDAKRHARKQGFTLRKTEGDDYRLCPKGGREAQAYYSDNAADLIATVDHWIGDR